VVRDLGHRGHRLSHLQQSVGLRGIWKEKKTGIMESAVTGDIWNFGFQQRGFGQETFRDNFFRFFYKSANLKNPLNYKIRTIYCVKDIINMLTLKNI